MNMRKIKSMTMLLSLIVLTINSIMLYVVPEGRIAYWAGWKFLGLTKGDWGAQHTTVGVLFLIAGVMHIFYNWKPMLAYMFDKSSSSTINSAVPGNRLLTGAQVDFRELLTMTAEEVATRVEEVTQEMGIIEEAEQVLSRNTKTAYNRALKILEPALREYWEDMLEDGEVEATAAALKDFIQCDLLPSYRSELATLRHHEEIKQQVIGEGISTPVMENLSRYETHLDRKFQRTLGMLIKLKDLRG